MLDKNKYPISKALTAKLQDWDTLDKSSDDTLLPSLAAHFPAVFN